MLLTIADFKRRVALDMGGLVADLQDVTGRYGAEEADAWRSSLPTVTAMLSAKALESAHIYIPGVGHVAPEYQLPAASNWCDLVLLGANNGRDAALVVELKHWATAGDNPGPIEGLMLRNGYPQLHPSRQVERYTEYIRRFHSETQRTNATVNGCVVFTRSGSANSYSIAPNHLLAANYPIFTTNTEDVDRRFPDYLSKLITHPSEDFAKAFVQGQYKQDRGFVKQIGAQILNSSSSPFVLLDNQEKAFLLCKERVSRVLDSRDGSERKHVVIVTGPPGSGKSVVAARLWASLVSDDGLKEGDVVVTTTSASQNSNWIHLVRAAASHVGAAGIIKKATQYHPVSTHEVGRLRAKHGQGLFADAATWRENLALLNDLTKKQRGAENNTYLVSLVDEAHALINPEHVAGRGQFGFAPTLGPQAFHIIRASRVAVFFMDPDQGFRERENTALPDIKQWAAELGATVDEIDLSDAQFRCAGSKEYVEWIGMIRTNAHPAIAGRHAARWRKREQPEPQFPYLMAAEGRATYGQYQARGMSLSLFEFPEELEGMLRAKVKVGHTARLLASYCRPWKTDKSPRPHMLPPELQDFCIQTYKHGVAKTWAKPWNYVPPESGDYTLFVQGAPGSAMADDQLCEVGCPYAVRGFDFDYVGIIWGSDLVWRKDRWIAQPEHVFETGIKALTSRAKKEKDLYGDHRLALLNSVWQSYRIILTRPILGVGIWVEDQETREYLKTAIGG